MADLPSILGGMAQGFVDFGKGVVDMFGTGGAAIGDLIESARTGKVTTKNQDDFRKWLYQTDSAKDAAAKGLGTTLNGVQTVLDYTPGVNVLTRNPLGNAAQGALGGLADEFKTYGEDYDLGRAGQRAAVSGAAAAASGSLADALKGSSNALLSSNTLQGLARGATGGAISGGGYAAIDGGDIMQGALQGAGMGALIGGATGAVQDFRPAKTYDMGLTDAERASRLKEVRKMRNAIGPEKALYDGTLDDASAARWSELWKLEQAYKNGFDNYEDYRNTLRPTKGLDDETLGLVLKNMEEPELQPWMQKGSHQPTFDPTMSSLASSMDRTVSGDSFMPDDFYQHMDWYGGGDTKPYLESASAIQKIRGNPNAKVTMYRATVGDTIYPNDWVTLSPEYAKQHLANALRDQPDAKIIKQTVAARDLRWPGDDINEFGYYPITNGDIARAKALETTLADADMAVNNVMESRIAPGQLGLFDDMPTQTPKIGTRQTSLFDQPQEGLGYYGSDIETSMPENGLISRDIEDLTQVPIDVNTLPKGWLKARELADMGKKAKQIVLDPNAPNRALNEYNMALYSDAQYGRNNPVADIIDRLGSRQLSNEIDRGATRLLADQLDESGDEFAKKFVTGAAEVGGNIGHYKDAPKASLADQRVSELLNIGRSTSMLSDSLAKPTSRNALGDQWKGTINIKGNDLSSGGDNASSVLWHERMHAFQDAEKMGYDKRVVDAYNDLREDLAKLQHDNKQILRDHGEDAKYWGKPIEQEARMAQHYLDSNYGVNNLSKVYARDSKGKIIRVDDNGQELDPNNLHYYTGKPVKKTEYAAEDKQIKAAFDKFIGKLQKLSRQGVALPALAALLGGGAYMASQENDKEKEVK